MTDNERCYFCLMGVAKKKRTVKNGDGRNVGDDKILGLGWCYDVAEVGWLEMQGRRWMVKNAMRDRR